MKTSFWVVATAIGVVKRMKKMRMRRVRMRKTTTKVSVAARPSGKK